MISTHVYSAYLIGTPDVALSLVGGQLTLDDTRAPHVQGDIEIGWPGHWNVIPDDLPTQYGGIEWVRDDEILDALDPKLTPRVRVEVDGEYPSFSTHREFDLGLRTRTPDQVSRRVSLTLASDEALLDDYRTLTDVDLIAFAGDVAALCEEVIGTALGAPVTVGSSTADMTPYWSVTNLHTNPEIVNAYGYGIGQGASDVQRVVFGSIAAIRWTTDAGTSNMIATPAVDSFRARPGSTYVFTMALLGQVSRTARLAIQWHAGGGTAPMQTTYGEPVTTSTSVWTDAEIVAQAPAGAEYFVPFVTTEGNGAGQYQYARSTMVYQGTRVVAPFSGETADDANYAYTWTASAHGSPSLRTPLADTADPDLFIWKAGITGLEFLRPIVQAAGLRLVCDEERTWTLRDEFYVASGALNIRYGVNLIDGSDRIDRDSGLWADAQVTRYIDDGRDGLRREWVDSFALVDPPTRVNYVEVKAPYAGPGRSEYAVRRAQGLGREVTASAVARWTERAEQPITIILDGAPIQAGKTSRITFNLGPGDSRDRVTVTTRSTDTDPDAWILQDPDTSWLDATDTETWLEAV